MTYPAPVSRLPNCRLSVEVGNRRHLAGVPLPTLILEFGSCFASRHSGLPRRRAQAGRGEKSRVGCGLHPQA